MSIRRKFHKLACSDGAREREELLGVIKDRCGMTGTERKKRAMSAGKIAALASCCAAAVCAAIILPCVLLRGNGNGNGGDGGSGDRYCADWETRYSHSQYSIKQHNEVYGTNLLYLDWYFDEDNCSTHYIELSATGEKIAISENIINLDTFDSVAIDVMKTDIHIDSLEGSENTYGERTEINGTTIKWAFSNSGMKATFIDGDYKYYFMYIDCQDETRFFEILTELLEKKSE